MSMSSQPLVLGTLIGGVCLAIGAFLGASLAEPRPASIHADTARVESKLEELERAVTSLSRARSQPLVASREGTEQPASSADPTPLVTASNDETLAALAALTARIDAFDTSLPKALRPADEDGIPSTRKAMNADLVLELLGGERGDAGPRLIHFTYAQVYEELGGPSWIGTDEHGTYWVYEVEGGKWPQLNVWFVDDMVSRAYAPF